MKVFTLSLLAILGNRFFSRLARGFLHHQLCFPVCHLQCCLVPVLICAVCAVECCCFLTRTTLLGFYFNSEQTHLSHHPSNHNHPIIHPQQCIHPSRKEILTLTFKNEYSYIFPLHFAPSSVFTNALLCFFILLDIDSL